MAKIKYSLDVFIGKLVEVVTTTQITVTHDSDVGAMQKSQPMIIPGIFLGHDKENIYIGDEDGSLSDTLMKRHCVHVGVTKTRDKFDDLMDEKVDNGSFN